MSTLFPDGEIIEITVRRKKRHDSNLWLSHTKVVTTTEANAFMGHANPSGIMRYAGILVAILRELSKK